MKLLEWLREREINARRIASGKHGEDCAGWLEDADYFKRAAEAIAAAVVPAPQLARSIERWQACDPHAMANCQSAAAIEFAFVDAKHDILALHAMLNDSAGNDGVTVPAQQVHPTKDTDDE